jgi:hypothetical protein
MVITQSLDSADPSPSRLAVATAFQQLSPFLSADDVEPFLAFLICDSDINPDVRC